MIWQVLILHHGTGSNSGVFKSMMSKCKTTTTTSNRVNASPAILSDTGVLKQGCLDCANHFIYVRVTWYQPCLNHFLFCANFVHWWMILFSSLKNKMATISTVMYITWYFFLFSIAAFPTWTILNIFSYSASQWCTNQPSMYVIKCM